MSATCSQCGAVLAAANAFCTNCGAPRTAASGAGAPRRFCTTCGAPLGPETKFCTKCGAPAGTAPVPSGTVAAGSSDLPDPRSANAASTPAAPPAVTPASSGPAPIGRGDASRSEEASSATVSGAPRQAGAPVTKSGAALPKIVVDVAIVALFIVVIAGGVWYAVHRAKQKAAQIEAEKNLANLATNGKGGQNGDKQSAEDVSKAISDLAATANALAQNAQKQGAIPPNAPGAPSSRPAAPYGWTLENGKLVPAPSPFVPIPTPAPPSAITPAAATGNTAHDWALKYERTENGPEADLVVRTGDINNLGFGWPQGFDPFSGESTPIHSFPWQPGAGEPDGTDRIMVASVLGMPPDQPLNTSMIDDGYSGVIGFGGTIRCQGPAPPGQICKGREDSLPQAIRLVVGALPPRISAVLIQIFADDFQAPSLGSHFQVSMNGTRIPSLEYAINALNQGGPVGKLVSVKLLPEYWPLLKSGEVKLFIDDPTTKHGDGYAVDFVRILVNPRRFKYEVALTATVTDAQKHTPIAGATVMAALDSASTDRDGKCQFKGLPAGMVIATASAPGYDENSAQLDLPAGQAGQTEIQLHRHEETTSALEQSIAKTGTATIYGIHFDTGSAKLRPDSIPALEAVLGLINNKPGSNWIIAGHTDNQGSDALNLPLSKARAASVISWLRGHGVASGRLEPLGFGSTRPVADNATANGRFLNRRVEISPATKQ
jgi:OmpA-OmpF porin, OOP family